MTMLSRLSHDSLTKGHNTMSKIEKRDISRSPTQKTLAYIETLCAYKKTHIEREEARLAELETMRAELLALIGRKEML